MSARKIQYTNDGVRLCTRLAVTCEKLKEWSDGYFDRGYNTGGSDVLLDADIATTNRVAADVEGLVNIVEQLNNLLENLPVVSADWDATLSKMRNDF